MPELKDWQNTALEVAQKVEAIKRERDELRAAAQAVVDRWDSTSWTWDGSTAELVGKLREALAKGAKQ